MIAEEIWKLLHATPFQPFVVRGKEIGAVRVREPRAALLTRTRKMLIVDTVEDSVKYINTSHITEISAEAAA